MRKANVDQAALLGAAVAGVIAISASEGRYEALDSVSGVVLGLLLLTYGPRAAQPLERLAVAAVGGLVACLAAAWPIDLVVHWIASANDQEWTSGVLAVVWLAIVLREVGKRPRPDKPAEEPTQPTPL